MLNLHDNVVVTSNVTFVTHDIIDWMLNYEQFNTKGLEQYIGPIEVFDNVFIGNDSIILYNTKIGPNAIVAAGSVVVKNVPEGAIVGGNPARVIGNINDFIKRRKERQYPSKKEGIENIMRFYWEGGNNKR